MSKEQGDIEKAAARLVINSLEIHSENARELSLEDTPDRIPPTQRLGPVNEPQSAFNRLGPRGSPTERDTLPQSEQPAQRKKASMPPIRHITPLSLAMVNAGIRKRKAARAAKISKTIPRNEKNNSKSIPLNEENVSKTKLRKFQQNKESTSSKLKRDGPSSGRPQRRSVETDFQNPPSPLP